MGFILGLFVGFALGLLVAGLCNASGRADLEMELMMKDKNGD